MKNIWWSASNFKEKVVVSKWNIFLPKSNDDETTQQHKYALTAENPVKIFFVRTAALFCMNFGLEMILRQFKMTMTARR